MRSLLVTLGVALMVAACAQVGPVTTSGTGGTDPATSIAAPTVALDPTTTLDAATPTPVIGEASTSEPATPPTAAPTPNATPKPTPRPTAKPTPRPTPKPTFNPNWTMNATVSDAKLDPAAGTYVDSLTWTIKSAADGATCELYLRQYVSGNFAGNASLRVLYHPGTDYKFKMNLAPDIHTGYATYTMACFIGAETYENKHWGPTGQISIE